MECCDIEINSLIPLNKVVAASIADSYEDFGKMRQLTSHWAARGFRNLQNQSLQPPIKKGVITVNQNTHTATLPLDFKEEKFVGILDCRGYKVPLKLNTKITDTYNIPDLTVENRCEKCNQDSSICNDLVVTQEVNLIIINNTTYEETITKKLYPNGDYYLETMTPFYDYITSSVVYPLQPKREFITNFELKPCGCLETSPANIFGLQTYCPDVYCNHFAPCDNQCTTNYGSYKIYPESGLIQFDPRYRFDKVYIEYEGFMPKRNGQYMIPEVAFETLVEWTKFKMIDGKRSVSNADKQWRWQRYTTEKANMERMLGRIDLAQIIQSVTMLPKFDVDYYVDWACCFNADIDVNANTISVTTSSTGPGGGSGGGGSSTTCQCTNTTTIINRGAFVLAVKVDGNPGSPVAGVTTYQNNLLKSATDIEWAFLAHQVITRIDNDFTFDPVTGTINIGPNVFVPGNSLIINYNKSN